MVAVGKFSMKQVQDAWRGRSALRGYHFGFNLKTLRPDEASLRDWFVEAQKAGVTGRKDIEATAYVTPLHAYVARNAAEFRVALGRAKVALFELTELVLGGRICFTVFRANRSLRDESRRMSC